MPVAPSFTSAQWGWILFDLGSFGFCTCTINTYMPVTFKEHHFKHLDPHLVTAYWGYAMSCAMLLGAVGAPILGAIADKFSMRKMLLSTSSLLACIGCALFPHALDGGSQFAIVIVAMTYLSYLFSVGMYNSLLVYIFDTETRHSASASATAYGNAGAAILLSAVYLIVQQLHPDGHLGENTMKGVFAACGVWWLCFAAPMMIWTPEPQTEVREIAAQVDSTAEELSFVERTRAILAEYAQFQDLWRFVLTSVFVNESSGVVFHMSFIFALSIGAVSRTTAIHVTIWNRWISILFSLLWGELIKREVSPKLCYMAVICLLFISAGLCAILHEEWQYWCLSTMLALAGTGGFSFFRSLLSDLSPPDKAAQVFGFCSSIGRMSGFLGPLVFGLVAHATGNTRMGFIPVMLFLLLALLTLSTVDFERGNKIANPRLPVKMSEEPTDAKTEEDKPLPAWWPVSPGEALSTQDEIEQDYEVGEESRLLPVTEEGEEDLCDGA